MNPVNTQKMPCQPSSGNNNAPTIGAITGATPKIIITRDIITCAAGPSRLSRMTARPTTRPAPAHTPCKPRQASSMANEVDTAAPTEASEYTSMPATITGLRPIASEIAPWNRLIVA